MLPFYLVGQNNKCFEIEANSSAIQDLNIFSKYVNVLDCIHIYAEQSVSDAKMFHVASIAAELLDNNEDGIIDDLNVQNQLLSVYTIMPIFSDEGSSAEDILFDNFDNLINDYNFCAGAVLYNNEIDPSSPGFWSNDASVEEILHTINNCSHIEIYPNVFGLNPNSSQMSDAMDVARGGQFLTIPIQYPEEGWYHYDDWTCDYQCMSMEYLYWSIVANMGLLDNSFICAGIYNEWELCTPEDFESIDVLMHAIITNPQYQMPQIAPDGNYCQNSIISDRDSVNKSIIKVIDILGRENNLFLHFEIYDDGSVEKKYIF